MPNHGDSAGTSAIAMFLRDSLAMSHVFAYS